MPSPWRPWFEWGFSGNLSTLSLRWPMSMWEPADDGVGGSATAASGIQEAYHIRRDRVVSLDLRVEEDELPSVRDFIRWARSSGHAFRFRFEQTDPATEYDCLLESSRWEDGSRVTYSRDPEYSRLFRVPLDIRTERGVPLAINWSTEAMPDV